MSLNNETCVTRKNARFESGEYVSGKNVEVQNGEYVCNITNLPISRYQVCDAYKPNNLKNQKDPNDDPKIFVDKTLAALTFLILIVGGFILVCYDDHFRNISSVYNYALISIFTMIPVWSRIKDYSIRHKSYIISMLISFIYYLLFYLGGDERNKAALFFGSIEMFAYILFYIKFFTKYGQEMSN